MKKTTLPDYPPPDKCKRPTKKFDLEESDLLFPGESPNFEIDAGVVAVLNDVSRNRLTAWLETITGGEFGTRHTVSPLNVRAANWLRNEFQSIGYTDVTLQNFIHQELTRHNVIARKPGTPGDDSVIIVCAHYDSRMQNLNDHNSAAPGANDNASGIITLLELARVLRQMETDSSVLFICFSGEEQGLLGSKAYAQHANESGMNIRLVINLDMVGHPSDAANPAIIIEVDNGNASSANNARSRQFAQQMAAAAVAGTSIATRFGQIYSSDYMPFEHFGYVCVGLYDGADGEDFYHTADDTPEKVDTGFCAELVKLLTAFISHAARMV